MQPRPPPRIKSVYGMPRGKTKPSGDELRAQRARELRIYGMNAVLAVFADRPDAIRKIYYEKRQALALQEIIHYCEKERIGFREVEREDLEKIAQTTHHEGVVAEITRISTFAMQPWLRGLPKNSSEVILLLDGIGNPHNFGALLRSAAHFGVAAVLLPADAGLALSATAYRIAEGAAERVDIVTLDEDIDEDLVSLQQAGFVLAATHVRTGALAGGVAMPARVVLCMGSETQGVSPSWMQRAKLQLQIPGSGCVESLNVAVATAVLLYEFRRQHPLVNA
jgi:RNA methyltransferase, TrmH family